MQIQVILIFLVLFVGTAGPVFASAQLQMPAQLQGIGNAINSSASTINMTKGWSDYLVSGIQNLINGIIGNANIQGQSNPLGVDSGKLTTVSNSGFKVASDLVHTTFDVNDFISVLINTFSPIKIPFWIVVGLSTIGTIVLLVKIGKMAMKKAAIIIGIILAFILILMVLGIHNSL